MWGAITEGRRGDEEAVTISAKAKNNNNA